MEKLLELLFLQQIKGIGNAIINKSYINSIREADDIDEFIHMISEGKYNIDLDLMKSAKQDALKKYKKIIEQEDLYVFTIFDKNYPKQFLDLGNNKPPILYAKGNIGIIKEKSIAMVGTRKPSVWSQRIEDKLVKRIVEQTDRVIVSGLALGCDKIAHESTLEAKGKTIAVLPSGINVVTPSQHKSLAEDILEKNGCILSEYEPNETAKLSKYVARNRLIAALAESTFVIECSLKSGTMHTVDSAKKMNRNIACYSTNDMSKGDFSGNKYIIDNLGAEKVSNLEELKIYLDRLDYVEENSKQLSIWD